MCQEILTNAAKTSQSSTDCSQIFQHRNASILYMLARCENEQYRTPSSHFTLNNLHTCEVFHEYCVVRNFPIFCCVCFSDFDWTANDTGKVSYLPISPIKSHHCAKKISYFTALDKTRKKQETEVFCVLLLRLHLDWFSLEDEVQQKASCHKCHKIATGVWEKH